jgi:hypothetical protein
MAVKFYPIAFPALLNSEGPFNRGQRLDKKEKQLCDLCASNELSEWVVNN